MQQNQPSDAALRELRHEDPQWELVKPHLPDPATATEQQLETVGDVLRARRFPEDALDYYIYALRRGGGNEVTLMNKLGVTQLDLRHTAAARAYFERAVKLKKKDAVAWNNLGAVEYIDGRFATAISDYSKAIKLNKTFGYVSLQPGNRLFRGEELQRRAGTVQDRLASSIRTWPITIAPAGLPLICSRPRIMRAIASRWRDCTLIWAMRAICSTTLRWPVRLASM